MIEWISQSWHGCASAKLSPAFCLAGQLSSGWRLFFQCDLLDSRQKRVSPPVKWAPSTSCVPLAMAAVAVRLMDRASNISLKILFATFFWTPCRSNTSICQCWYFHKETMYRLSTTNRILSCLTGLSLLFGTQQCKKISREKSLSAFMEIKSSSYKGHLVLI